MLLRRIIIYPLITLIFLTAALTCMAQEGNWLHGNWQGKAYLPGNDPQQNYDLILTITSIKGKKFDGILKAAKSADTTIKFDSKVTGIINDLYLVINIATWKVNCANCKPQNLAFSIESGKFVFKGEARGCSIECTWITEFSKNMAEFDEGEQQSLHSLAKEEIAPEPEPPVVEKKPEPEVIVPPPVVITPPPAVRIVILPAGAVVLQPHNAALLQPKKPGAPLNKKTSLKIKENIPPPPPERIPVLAAVPVVLKERKNALVPAQKLPSSLTSRPSMAIKQNNPPPPERIPVLAAGPVVLKERKNALVPAQKLPSSLTSRPSMAIKQNNPPPPERIPVLAAGTVVLMPHNKALLVPQKPMNLLPNGHTSLAVKETSFPVPEAHKIPASNDTIVVKPVIAANTVPPAQKAPPVVRPDPVSLLPAGYADRQINVVRTLTVNTDSITLRVYDNGVVDGDIVSVVYNDKVIVDKLSLKSRALEIKIPVNKTGTNKLVFYAHNLGEFPPNTAKLEIYYGSKMEELTLSSDFTVSSAIDILYKQ